MTVIPAQVAGVKYIRVFSPNPAKVTLAAAALLGVREFYRVGGAQAIAALAYGTENHRAGGQDCRPRKSICNQRKENRGIRLRHRLFGGSNRRARCFAIDGEPSFIASDLVAQAEHDPEALVLLITTSRKLAGAVSRSVVHFPLGKLDRAAIDAKVMVRYCWPVAAAGD